jgi:hypothetical protein
MPKPSPPPLTPGLAMPSFPANMHCTMKLTGGRIARKRPSGIVWSGKVLGSESNELRIHSHMPLQRLWRHPQRLFRGAATTPPTSERPGRPVGVSSESEMACGSVDALAETLGPSKWPYRWPLGHL